MDQKRGFISVGMTQISFEDEGCDAEIDDSPPCLSNRMDHLC
jgi:hypothetical protein